MSRAWQQKLHPTHHEAGSLSIGNIGALAAYISQRDMMIIQGFVDCFPEELSGLASVEVTGRGFEIAQPFILKQGTGPGHTDLTEATAEFVMDLVQRGQTPAPYKFWWHSHVNFEPFWSGRDEATAQNFGNQFMLSMVLNKRREFSLRFDQYHPFPFTVYDIPLVVELPEDEEIKAHCQAEIKDKIFTGPLRLWRRRKRLITQEEEPPMFLSLGRIPIVRNEDTGDSPPDTESDKEKKS